MASDGKSSSLQEKSLDIFDTIDFSDTRTNDSPSHDSHSSGAFSPIRLDGENDDGFDDKEHDADSDDSSGRDVSFDPIKNKLQDRRKTKRRTSSNVFTFKNDNVKNDANGGQFDIVDLNVVNRESTQSKNRRSDIKWTSSQSFSSSTEENDFKIVSVSTKVNDERTLLSSGSASQTDCSTKKGIQNNAAVDGLLFDIYDKYQSVDHATESDFTEMSTTSVTSIYVASSFENEDRPKLDQDYLETKELEELEKMLKELKRGVSMLSSKLVRLLKQRDRSVHKIQDNFNVLTALLQARSQKRRVDTRIRFSFVPKPGKQGFRQWIDALKAVSRISHGIPPSWRKRTWLSLAEYFLKDIEWERFKKLCFNDRRNPDDDELDTQIVKDLHRTGCGWFFEHDTAEDRASLKRVLLAYARWNKQIGYCQGFNVIAALILQVMEGNEEHALKVMIFLVDYILPRNYFSNNLRALSVDMAVLRDLMQMKLSPLAHRLQQLQKEAMDQSTNSVASYEPPLINMFTMQWFLTLFATCLPRNTVLRIWDAVLLEGSEILLRVALAIWAKLGTYFENVKTAADFYMKMGELIQQLITDEFIDVQKLTQVVYQMAPFPWTSLDDLREKYTYDIHPFATFKAADRKGDQHLQQRKNHHKHHQRHSPESDGEGSAEGGRLQRRKRMPGKQQKKQQASDDDDVADNDEAMVGCLGFVAGSSSGDMTSSPSSSPVKNSKSQTDGAAKPIVPVTSKTDITKVTPGAYITDQDTRNAYKEQMRATELLRESEKLDLGKLRNQYGRMRRLQQKAMLVFNADDFKNESYKAKNPPSAINHLFVDVNNITAPPRARYRKPSNFPALKAPSKNGSPVPKPFKESPKFVYEGDVRNNNRRTSARSISESASVDENSRQKRFLERSDSFSITNPYVMHEVQAADGKVDSNPGTANPDAHAEMMHKAVPSTNMKTPPMKAPVSSEENGNMKSTSLLYKVDKSALYPSNFKPFPNRSNSRRKTVPGK